MTTTLKERGVFVILNGRRMRQSHVPIIRICIDVCENNVWWNVCNTTVNVSSIIDGAWVFASDCNGTYRVSISCLSQEI